MQECDMTNFWQVSHILLLISALFLSFYLLAGVLYRSVPSKISLNRNYFWENVYVQ